MKDELEEQTSKAQLEPVSDESFSAGFSGGATNPPALTALMHYLPRALTYG